MRIEIDRHSGFCFGVLNAIEKAEQGLRQNKPLYCLGDIVHNELEVNRLEALGLVTISRETYFTLSNCRVLLRAHGEPPETYTHALNNNIELIDATCPVVLKLQERVRKASTSMSEQNGQLILFGKEGHAEVRGLSGQTGNQAIIIGHPDELHRIDPLKPTVIFAQTTQSVEQYRRLRENLEKMLPPDALRAHDTICRQVSNRAPYLQKFANLHDVIIFVGGKKSSNARVLFDVCRNENPRSHFISEEQELTPEWFSNCRSAGICGATSTPLWLMERVANTIRQIVAN